LTDPRLSDSPNLLAIPLEPVDGYSRRVAMRRGQRQGMKVDLGLDEQLQEALVEGWIPATTFAERCLGL
jgi:hypothetical protein